VPDGQRTLAKWLRPPDSPCPTSEATPRQLLVSGVLLWV
jgi:hypothetical protein